jgi:hypothetical protein
VKKFRNLWYTGLAITGIPVIIIIFASFLALVKTVKVKTVEMEEATEQVKDTVKIEVIKRVVVKDTVYIRTPITKPQPTQVKDTL